LSVKPYKAVDMTADDNLSINLLYRTVPGRMCLKLLTRPSLSRLFGYVLDRKVSAFFVNNFIRKNDIDMKDYKPTKYVSFNDFFTREVKTGYRPISMNPRKLISPCDGKLTAFPIKPDSAFTIKDSPYTVGSLLRDGKLAKGFAGGTCLIFRLTPDNYHRYCYIDDGEILSHKKIKGVLHTVRPIAMDIYQIYKQNAREYVHMRTKNFGDVIHMEVGALFVGRIKNHKNAGKVKRGEEKGMFEFGGSTIVMLFKKDAVKIEKYIFDNTKANKETIVKMGNLLGEKK
jgi:phosphatidylserine decarboxylase